jgi:hypothetical protein
VSKKYIIIILILLCAGLHLHARVTIPTIHDLSPSNFVDTEFSTNIAFKAFTIKRPFFSVFIERDVITTNSIVVSIGIDRDLDGVLSRVECSLSFKIKTNELSLRDHLNCLSYSHELEAGCQNLKLTLFSKIENQFNQFLARDEKAEICEAKLEKPISYADWNLMRVAISGSSDAKADVTSLVSPIGTFIYLR